MENNQSLRQRKFLLWLPIIVLPFICAIFYTLSGGVEQEVIGTSVAGLNARLPAAKLDSGSSGDKLSFYAMAAADSVKRAEQIKLDPYRNRILRVDDSVELEEAEPLRSSTQIQQRMAAIQKRVLQQSSTNEGAHYGEVEPKQINRVGEKTTRTIADPEMEAINSTLDKILLIQNPEQKQIGGTNNGKENFSVNERSEFSMDTDHSFFGKKKSPARVSFLDDRHQGSNGVKTFAAMIPNEQVLQSGATVKLELSMSLVISGIMVPAGTPVFGVGTMEGERLKIHIPSIRFQDDLLPVSLDVYDMDGLEGIYVPGSINREVSKASAENALQSTGGVSGFDMSLKTQAAAAGIGAAKSLLSKKVKQIRVTITAGYKVLLRDSKNNNNP